MTDPQARLIRGADGEWYILHTMHHPCGVVTAVAQTSLYLYTDHPAILNLRVN